MVNGFFLGGAAEGIAGAQKQALAERAQTEETGIRGRALSLQENIVANTQQQEVIKRTDELIANTMATVAETIKTGITVGRDPATIQKAVMPLVESAKALGQKIGRDPKSFDAMVQAQLTSPTAVEGAAVTGRAAATQAVAQDTEERRLLQQTQPAGATETPELTRRYKTAKEKTDAENALRDDYLKQAQPFITVRDYYQNFKSAEASGAGDITRVFAFMKIQDPGSAVLPGEAANAQNASGVPETVRAMYNRLIGGGILSPEARNQLATQADKLYQSRNLAHDRLTTQFANIADKQGLSKKSVIIELPVPVQAPVAATTSAPKNAGTTPGGIKFKVVP